MEIGIKIFLEIYFTVTFVFTVSFFVQAHKAMTEKCKHGLNKETCPFCYWEEQDKKERYKE